MKECCEKTAEQIASYLENVETGIHRPTMRAAAEYIRQRLWQDVQVIDDMARMLQEKLPGLNTARAREMAHALVSRVRQMGWAPK